MLLTDYFGEFVHNIILALALGDVAHEETAVRYGRVHLQLFTGSDLMSVQL